ncbi:MAG TPA: anti-phage dCTP deaminase [Kofleriaceae bacterium]|nr:anti-phage dCTP deaminase [Kofleriaceae bacterium]
MEAKQGARRSLPRVDQKAEDLVGSNVDQAKSHDLVFAVTGYAGAGASWVATALADKLTAAGYVARTIQLSELIKTACAKLGEPLKLEGLDKLTCTERLQGAGDDLRRGHGTTFVAGLGIREVYQQREAARAQNKDPQIAFIIDQLKHPDEEAALRAVYGNGFYLISVVCHPQVRRGRLTLKFKGSAPKQLSAFIERDEAADEPHGQQVRKTLHRGDFFVSNDRQSAPSEGLHSEDPLSDGLERFVNIVLRRGVVRPTKHERGMYSAWAASLRSACLSRQVGAAILNESGEILSTGTNDVPKYKGGLYEDDDGDADHRCYRWTARTGAPQCHNDHEKKQIYSQIYSELSEQGLLSAAADAQKVRRAIEGTRVRELIEFSRAVHAEMDALVSLARIGGLSCRNGSLYCTTYPCHSCARHIVAAGIAEVFFIEPYAKSMATDLHQDSICDSTETHGASEVQVNFQLFSGVAPRRYPRLFEKRSNLKDEEGYFKGSARESIHHDPVLTKSFKDLEREIAARIDDIERSAATVRPEGA